MLKVLLGAEIHQTILGASKTKEPFIKGSLLFDFQSSS